MLINEFEVIPNNSLLVFLHITKTGGVSFGRVLQEIYGEAYFRESQTQGTYLKKLTKEERKGVKAIAGHFRYGAHSGFSALPLYVTCLRDPVDRITSLYNHISRDKSHKLNAMALKLGIDDFCVEIAEGRLRSYYSQCEIICNKDDFFSAKEFLKTFLVYCDISQLDDMQRLVYNKLLGDASNNLFKKKNVNTNKAKSSGRLSEEVMDYLYARYVNDLKLSRYARKKFSENWTSQ